MPVIPWDHVIIFGNICRMTDTFRLSIFRLSNFRDIPIINFEDDPPMRVVSNMKMATRFSELRERRSSYNYEKTSHPIFLES